MKVKLLKKVRKRYRICIKECDGVPCRYNVYDQKAHYPYNANRAVFTTGFTPESKDKDLQRCLDFILFEVVCEWKLKLRPDKETKVWWNK